MLLMIIDGDISALQVDQHGLDEMDNKILLAIIDKYKGGPWKAKKSGNYSSLAYYLFK